AHDVPRLAEEAVEEDEREEGDRVGAEQRREQRQRRQQQHGGRPEPPHGARRPKSPAGRNSKISTSSEKRTSSLSEGLRKTARIERPTSVRKRKSESSSVSTPATPNAMRRATSTNTGPSQTVDWASALRTRCGSGPKASRAVFSSTRATPSIRRICISCGAS